MTTRARSIRPTASPRKARFRLLRDLLDTVLFPSGADSRSVWPVFDARAEPLSVDSGRHRDPDFDAAVEEIVAGLQLEFS